MKKKVNIFFLFCIFNSSSCHLFLSFVSALKTRQTPFWIQDIYFTDVYMTIPTTSMNAPSVRTTTTGASSSSSSSLSSSKATRQRRPVSICSSKTDKTTTSELVKQKTQRRRRGNYAPTELDILNDPSTFGECIYSHADWSHAYASTRKESEYTIKAENIIGEIPKDLREGILYRVGPGKFEREKRYKHMLDGDGLALRFGFNKDESEFEKIGINKIFLENFDIPFVEESAIKIGLKKIKEIKLPNECILLICNVKIIIVDDTILLEDGNIDFDNGNIASISGLQSYYSSKKMKTLRL